MTKIQYLILSALLAIIAAAEVLRLFAIGGAPDFEYRVEAVPDLQFDRKMTELGGDGWELVFARRASDKGDMLYEVILKRPR